MVYFIYTHNKQTIFKLYKTGALPEFIVHGHNIFLSLPFLSFSNFLHLGRSIKTLYLWREVSTKVAGYMTSYIPPP